MSYEITTKLGRMDPEFKEQWVKALRSGDHKQGSAKLHRVIAKENYYCCLGLACTLVEGLTVAKSSWYQHKTDLWSYNLKYNEQDSFLPFEAAEQMFPGTTKESYQSDPMFRVSHEYTDDSGIYHENERTYYLSHLNDSGMTFSQIADIINYMW